MRFLTSFREGLFLDTYVGRKTGRARGFDIFSIGAILAAELVQNELGKKSPAWVAPTVTPFLHGASP